MKKITFFAFLLLLAWGGHAQCIRTAMWPSSPVQSNNVGLPQDLGASPYSSEYSQISNLSIGSDYLFTAKVGTTNKYITVTDVQNVVITHGESPLAVDDIAVSQVRLHFSDNAACASTPFVGLTVTLQAILECSPPINLSVDDITTTTANFEWQPQGSETEWQVLVLPSTADAPTASTTGTDVSTNPAHSTSLLTPGGYFKFYVRAKCGSNFSPWNGPLNFASKCDPATSISENFNTTPTGTLPVCWSQIKSGTGASQFAYAQVTDYNFNSASRTVVLYNSDSGTSANIMLATPTLGNLSAGTHRAKFFARSGNATGSLQVGTVDVTTSDAIFTEIETIALTGTHTEYAVDFTEYEGTDTHLAFRFNTSGTYNYIFIDDVRWELAPSCADVSQITVPAATIGTSTATVNWVANSGETQWDVVYGLASVNDPSTLTPISPAPTTNPEASLTGLLDNTTYKVWVRSVCSGSNGVWVGPQTFKTACIPVTTINENFDAYAYGTLPGCWAAIKSGTGVSQYAYAQVTDYNFQSPSRTAVLYNSDSGSAANIILATPALSNIGAGTHRIKFYARSGAATGSLQIGTLDNNSAEGTFTELETISLTGTHTEYVVNFTELGVTDSHIAFRFNSTGTYAYIFIDNVVWEPIPSCADVTGVTVPTTTINGATVNWTPGDNETQWDVVYGLASVTDPNTLTPISPAPTQAETTLAGLTDNTSYKVWVRSVCGTQNGAWIGPVSFKTPCLPVNTFDENFDTTAYNALPSCWSAVKSGTGVSQYAAVYVIDYNFYSASRAIYMYNSDSGSGANIMLASPNLGNVSAGTHRVKFFARSSSSTGSLQVGTVDNTSGDAVFTEVETIAITSDYTEYAVNFTEYDGTDTNIAFRMNSGMYSYVYLDNVRWEVAPLCADVTDIAIDGITTVTANVNWEAQGSETNWQVVYGPSSVTDPTTLTPSSLLTVTNFPISELTENTPYKVWVRSSCGTTNGDGAWIGPVQFTTLCLPTTVPYVQDFETATTPALPSCSVLQNNGTGNNWRTVNNPGYGFPNKTLNYPYNTSNAANVWYFTKGISLTAGTEYSISYKYGNNSTTSYKENLTVKFGLDPNADDMTEDIAEHLEIQTAAAQSNDVTFTVPTTGVYYFGFHAHSISNQDQLYVDDIKVDVVLKNNNFNSSEFTFYPNPVKDVLNLSYTQNISAVTVYNLLGQKVIEKNINTNAATIDMSALSSGSYIVKVTSDSQTKTIKVIKE